LSGSKDHGQPGCTADIAGEFPGLPGTAPAFFQGEAFPSDKWWQ
jgi:hypothetical protein